MINKKAQGEIITTVLIILLVLAAVVIVWQVVKSTVTTGTEQISGGLDCVTISLEIVGNTSSNQILVKRNVGEGDLKAIQVIMNGTKMGSPIDVSLSELETKPVSTTNSIAKGDKIQIAAVLTGNKLCDLSPGTYTVS